MGQSARGNNVESVMGRGNLLSVRSGTICSSALSFRFLLCTRSCTTLSLGLLDRFFFFLKYQKEKKAV